MGSERAREYVAECFWPDVRERDLEALDARVTRVAARLEGGREPVHYLGSLLMRSDEVVLCFFQGSECAVRKAAEDAQVPFERLVEAARSPLAKAVKR
jgi:hypothetical protein